ncbi:hypothetical protein CAI21_07180 [Alkalilimnicola ehrlichii]|uniref:Porin domain-containing protein n=1 Tax=Alkalilimnicola ehrlichii TaxID=351052 RepID=A0A3E0X1A2_9GAMM|nr:porin [Alkalilimnicola ehrlichii]RFA30374.1 hypothetical protein CAI21_07180 [Alkalilimnicola ehrlichii]RFA37947.1 hypothetical protein CAL65_08520 [Alkalilimnicola ehrlichii]
MNRKIMALASAAALLAPAVASADVDVYGRAHLSVDFLDNGDDSAVNVSSNSSRLGFRGKHDLDYGLRGIYQIESEIRFDTQGGEIASRDTFAGIEGDFGMVRLGKFDTPLKTLRSRVDLFGDQVGDARNITRSTVRFDERFRNSIHYRTPNMAGFFADVQYSTNTDNAGGTDDNDNDAISVSGTYRNGALYAAIAYEQHNSPDEDLSAVRFAAAYDLGALRFTGLIQQADVDDDRTDNMYGVGVRYNLGLTNLKAQAYLLDADVDDADATMVALGVDHRLASNFTVYANYAFTSNDDFQNADPYRQARSGGTAAADGETASGLSLGMIYNF